MRVEEGWCSDDQKKRGTEADAATATHETSLRAA